MEIEDIEAWQAHPVTQAVINDFKEGLEGWRTLEISPALKTAEAFWQDSTKRELAIQLLDDLVALLGSAESLKELFEEAE